MILLSLALSCVGLCAGQEDLRGDKALPRPSLHAWPSWILPPHTEVTLRCSTPTRVATFFLKKKETIICESSSSSDFPERVAEFHLTDLQPSDAGEYTCEYRTRVRPSKRSLPSDVRLLLVTGHSSKPSLQAHHRGNVTAGENVTLQCQMPRYMPELNMCALLKKGTSAPIQLRHPKWTETGFLLQSVTVNDTGNYSCVYYQTKPPFWASEPSDHITIWVTDKTEFPKRAGAPLGTTEIILIATSSTFAFLFLLAAFLIYKYTCCGAALKRTKGSHSSKKPEEVVTDSSPATRSCSPALEEATQESRAEESHGVTYAELNTRALSKDPSNQVKEPLETCVYSTLKM